MVLIVFAQSLSLISNGLLFYLLSRVPCWFCCINKFYIVNDEKEKLNHMVKFWISNSLMLIKVSAILINPLVNCSTHHDVILQDLTTSTWIPLVWILIVSDTLGWGGTTLAPLAIIHQLKLHTSRSKTGTPISRITQTYKEI